MRFYRAICFDLFDTLVLFDKSSYFRIRDQGFLELGFDTELFNKTWKSTREDAFNGTIQTMPDRYQRVLELIGLPNDDRIHFLLQTEIAAIAASIKPVDGIQPLMENLVAHKKLLGLVSNASCVAPLVVKHLNWQVFFNEMVFSYREKVRKPDPQIFRLICDRLGVPANQAAYVSDGDRSELTGASDAAMDPIHFDPSGEFSTIPLPPGCFDCTDVHILEKRLLS